VALAYLLFACVSLAFGFGTNFFTLQPTAMPASKFVTVVAILFVFPGIAEELVFRGLMLPHRSEDRSPARQNRALVISIVIFILYHVVNAWLTFPVARPVFWDWRFLTIVAALGWICGWAYLKTGSLWPSIFIHWSIVVIWKACLGGPVFFE
jgi:predicted Abi (CAAX) family protease